MTDRGTTERCPTCGSNTPFFFITPECSVIGRHDDWHAKALAFAPSAPTSERVRELVEALKGIQLECDALLNVSESWAARRKTIAWGETILRIKQLAERVLARHQKV